MLTTKFSPRLPTSSPLGARLSTIPSGPNAFSKENREAALRERGLLPPLEPNKDLSVQEKEQDRVIPIVLPTGDPHSPTEVNTLSAADLIKKEWEAKNRSLEYTQRQRMNSFKFGGSSSVPGSPKKLSPEDSAIPDITALPTRNPLPSPHMEIATSNSQPSSLAVPPVPPNASSVSKPGSRPVTPLLDAPPELPAYLYPLPPSPRSVSRPNLALCSPPPSPTSVPLPPSPSVFDTMSLKSASGACTSESLNIRETSLTPTPTPPIIALTPCASVLPDSISINDAARTPLQKRTDLSAPLDESASSIQTPSLDSNSHTTADSILGTSESVAISGKGRFGGLKIKTHEGSNIPVIVESPIEDSFLEEQDVGAEVTLDGNQAATTPISGNEMKFSLSAPRMKRKGLTDPTNSGLDRKKSMVMNPFKRGNSAHADHSTTSSVVPPRRLSVKASLSNMRRSVVGTLSRKSIAENGGGKMFDASHLPPSPILPSTWNNSHSPTSPTFRTEEAGELSAIRRAVSPVLYTRGHILMEASHIEDEESRRVTEMAFLT